MMNSRDRYRSYFIYAAGESFQCAVIAGVFIVLLFYVPSPNVETSERIRQVPQVTGRQTQPMTFELAKGLIQRGFTIPR